MKVKWSVLNEIIKDVTKVHFPYQKVEALRFAIGDNVEVKTGPATWSRGSVVEHLYREDVMPPGEVAPYAIPCSKSAILTGIWGLLAVLRACLEAKGFRLATSRFLGVVPVTCK